MYDVILKDYLKNKMNTGRERTYEGPYMGGEWELYEGRSHGVALVTPLQVEGKCLVWYARSSPV